MNYAVINSETNIVENVIIWDGQALWAPPEGCYTKPIDGSNAGIGWSYIDGQFFAPVVQ